MAETIFYVLIGIIVADFLFERWLDWLNKSCWNSKLPEALKGIYDEEKYQKSMDYEKENHRFSQITSAYGLVLILGMFLLNGFGWLNGWANGFTSNIIFQALIFFGVLMFASDILNLPFSWYATFSIEERFGFNKTTPKLFVMDKLKGWLVMAILGGGILAAIVWFFQLAGSMFWLYAWGVVSFFSIFMAMFYSNLIVPLFNKQKPLEDGELKDAINALASKAGFKLNNIFVIDGSKRSTKANAYFTGLGAKKRIVLFDTLINDLETEEIVAVLAHEIGHYKHKHIVKGLITSLLQTGAMLFILSLFVNRPELSQALGAEKATFHLGLIAFGILYTPLSLVLGLIQNVVSRKNEYEADAFAANLGLGEALISGLKKLSVNNLSNLTPHPTYVFFHYSHPTVLQRMEALRK
ncbi:M48 family peptidase [Prolixibacteraceae bacterium JC049]|nr:M48 family peptidase [Prolixibacteraceae bacterium JC049]